MKLVTLLVVTLLIAAGPFRNADAQTFVFEKAEFVLSNDAGLPPDSAPWQLVSLPHRWHDTHPGTTGLGWYRIKFERAKAPVGTQAISIAHWRSRFVDFHVNGVFIGGSRDVTPTASIGLGTGVYLTIPPSLLRAGENIIHARMAATAYPINVQGLGRLAYGDARAVRKTAIANLEWGFYAERAFLAMALSAGLITFFVWLARRGDRVMFWFSMACLSWAMAGILFNALRWSDMLWLVRLCAVYIGFGLVVPAVVLSLRMVDLKLPRVEAAMWAFFVMEIGSYVLMPSLFQDPNTTRYMGLHAANAALLLLGVGITLSAAKRPLRWPIRVELTALLGMAAVLIYEAMRIPGWIDVEGPVLRPFHVPLMMLAIGTAIYERYVTAVRSTERANLELERRVEEKAREIEEAHARIDEANRARALAHERQRILADMHDGVGASLVGVLRHVQSGRIDARDLERQVRTALQEMRIAVDALEPAEGDLAAVLGELRYRLEPLIESAGARLVWSVAELPQVEALEPSAVFSIQRIVLEAIANVLNHASAREFRISVRDNAGRGIEIRIEDDGKGFDTSAPARGLGMRNMRARAERLGAELEIQSSPGEGTVVTLLVPYKLRRDVTDTPVSLFAAGPQATLVPAPG